MREESWTIDRCGESAKYAIRFYEDGGDGYCVKVVPASWWDRLSLAKFYFVG